MGQSPPTPGWIRATGRGIARAGSATWRAATAAGRAAGGAAVHVVESAAVYQDEAIGAANGLVGDGLEQRSSSWALPMTLRGADGAVLDLDRPLAEQLPVLALQGVVLGYAGTMLWYQAIARLDLARATAIVVPSIPLLSLAASFVVVGEVPTLRQMVGMLLTAVGVGPTFADESSRRAAEHAPAARREGGGK